MSESRFVHLHVHSEYSLLDGACRLKELIKLAKEKGQTHLALTDHGVMHGVLDFYQTCHANGIQPILGVEAYMAEKSRFDKSGSKNDDDENAGLGNSHIVLLARNKTGYENLMRLSSIAQLEGFYYKPRIDKDVLRQYSEGLICTSACLKGELATLVRRDRYEDARRLAKEYLSMFGEGNFYLEVQSNGLVEQDLVNKAMRELSNELSIPLVATTDVHYLTPDDAKTQDCLICIGTKKTLNDPTRMRIATRELYLKTGEEMRRQLPDYLDAVENTYEIARRCELELNYDGSKLHMPNYQIPEEEESYEGYLRNLVYKGAEERYGEVTEDVRARIERELDIIIGSDFTGYFLIVWDYMNFARKKGISVGPGRGSAAGSCVAYCLYITDIDPLRYGLLFERFLNPERISPPDIDTDFSDKRRDEVIRYVQEKYGKDRVAQICTFGTIGAKNAVRDVARVMGLPPSEGDRIAKLIPDGLGVTLKQALEEVPELRQVRDQDATHQELFRHALAIEGMVRNTGTHAAGIIIAPDDLCKFTPLMRGANKEEDVSTQFSMKILETIGLLKMDFLGLKNLSVIDGAVSIIRGKWDADFSIERIPMDDQKTFELLGQGKTNGVFQLESSGMKELLRKMQPESFSDIISLIALYRPGPLGSGMVDDFIRRKRGEARIEYDHPTLEPILRETYGIILYQEQVMQIANVIAGFTLGQADIMRRAMGKKKEDILRGMEQDFYKGAKERGVDRAVAERLWGLIFKFAGYGFNKSHSAAYAVITYRTAYLKAHYPSAFLASLLTTDMNDTNKVVKYIDDAKGFGIDVLPPDINESFEDFTVTDGGIRFGLAAIKNVGANAIRAIIQERRGGGPFKSLFDFCGRAKPGILNKSMLENLIRAGALDSFGYNRASLLNAYPAAMERAQGAMRDRAIGQGSLFSDFGEDVDETPETIEEAPELDKKIILQAEKALLGIYITGHPLNDFLAELELFAKDNIQSLQELAEKDDSRHVRILGIVSGLKKKKIKDGSRMGVFQLEDMTGGIEVVVMPSALEQYAPLIEDDKILLIEGLASSRNNQVSVRADSVMTVDEGWQKYVRELHLNVPSSELGEQNVRTLIHYFQMNPGETSVILHVAVPGAGVVDYAVTDMKIAPSNQLKLDLETLFQQCELRYKAVNGAPRERTNGRHGNGNGNYRRRQANPRRG